VTVRDIELQWSGCSERRPTKRPLRLRLGHDISVSVDQPSYSSRSRSSGELVASLAIATGWCADHDPRGGSNDAHLGCRPFAAGDPSTRRRDPACRSGHVEADAAVTITGW